MVASYQVHQASSFIWSRIRVFQHYSNSSEILNQDMVSILGTWFKALHNLLRVHSWWSQSPKIWFHWRTHCKIHLLSEKSTKSQLSDFWDLGTKMKLLSWIFIKSCLVSDLIKKNQGKWGYLQKKKSWGLNFF